MQAGAVDLPPGNGTASTQFLPGRHQGVLFSWTRIQPGMRGRKAQSSPGLLQERRARLFPVADFLLGLGAVLVGEIAEELVEVEIAHPRLP